MSLHLPSLDTGTMEVKADKPYGRVQVWFGLALLTLSADEARALANGLQNACVELAMPAQEVA